MKKNLFCTVNNKIGTKNMILAALIILCLGFIWINSLMPENVSGEMSGFVGKLLTKIFGDGFTANEHIIRKLAHGAEFMLYGVIIALFLYPKILPRLHIPVMAGIFTALCDETIQLFTVGRSGQIKDVWIDFSGYTAGVVLVIIVQILIEEGWLKHYKEKFFGKKS